MDNMGKIKIGSRVVVKFSYGELKGKYTGDEKSPIGLYHVVILDNGQKVLTTRMTKEEER